MKIKHLYVIIIAGLLIFCSCREKSLSVENSVPLLASQNTLSSITVTSPNGGEIFYAGDNILISWNIQDSIISHRVNIELYRDSLLINLIYPEGENKNQIWNVPNTIPSSDKYWIKIRNHDNINDYGLSGRFSIINN